MPLMRIVRTWRSPVVLGLVGFVIGCSEPVAPPIEKGEGQKVKADMGADRKTAKQARSGALKSPNQPVNQP